jgi:hypothetical protein
MLLPGIDERPRQSCELFWVGVVQMGVGYGEQQADRAGTG